MVHLFSSESHAFSPRAHLEVRAPGSGDRGAVPIALVVDPELRVGLGVLPPRIPLDGHARSADHLVVGEIEHHVVARELAVELARRVEGMRLPAVAVVDDHLGIPLREVEAPAPAPLAPRQGGGPGLPRDLDRQRVARGERPRQRPVGDGRVGGVRVIGRQRLTHQDGGGDALEGVVGVLQVLEPLAPLGRVGRCPAGAGAEGVQVLVHVEVVQRHGRAVDVADALAPAQHP